MATHKTPLVIGNWKMNPMSESEAITLAKAVAKNAKKVTHAKVVVASPLLFLGGVSKALKGSTVALGVQHIHPGPVGAFTGEVSPAMIAPYGVKYVIAGHSERRAMGETDTQVNAQVLMILKHRQTPVICVGERERDSQALFYTVVAGQIKAALKDVPKARFKDVVIAYEPVWAIGTGKNATPVDVQEMKLFIQKVITESYGRTAAAATTILYGGSVKADTAKLLYTEGTVHGFLVGGASLVASDFAAIIAGTN